MTLERCACGGFLGPASAACPHCARPRATASRLGVLGGVALAFTLMACYGRPPCKGSACKDIPPPADDASGAVQGAPDAARR